MSAQDLSSSSSVNSKARRSPSKTKNSRSFGDVVVARQEVGEFTGGYFVMPSMPAPTPSTPTSSSSSSGSHSTPHSPTHIKPQHHNSNKAPSYTYPRSRQHTSPNKKKSTTDYSGVPNKEKEHHHQQQQQQHRAPLTKTASLSELKEDTPTPRLLAPSGLIKKPSSVPLDLSKALELASSPQQNNNEGKKSPTSSRWAGPAFINAPPPSALPMPSFDTPSTKLSPPSSPPSKLTPWETLVQAAASHSTSTSTSTPAQPIATPAFNPLTSQSTLPLHHITQLPTTQILTQDLRRLLNIPTLTATPTLVRA